jgi:hypothetical protein
MISNRALLFNTMSTAVWGFIGFPASGQRGEGRCFKLTISMKFTVCCSALGYLCRLPSIEMNRTMGGGGE